MLTAIATLAAVGLASAGAAIDSPGAPRSLSSTVFGTAVTLTWDAPATGGAPTTYVVEAGSAAGLSDLAGLTTDARSFAAFAPPGTYFVRVRAFNAGGVGPASNEIVVVAGGCPPRGSPHVVPFPPRGLTFTIAGALVTLNWEPDTSGLGLVGTYLVVAGSSTGAADLAVIDMGGPVLTFAAVAPPGTYFVHVRGSNACGVGPPSNEVVIQVQ